MINDKLKLYVAKGKLKLALETIIQSSENPALKPIQENAILLISRLVSLEDKLLKGIISFEQSERIENQIRLSVLQLINEYSELENGHTDRISHQENIVKEEFSVIGKWYCEYYDPDHFDTLKVYWILKADNTGTLELYKKKNNEAIFNGPYHFRWRMENNLLTEISKDGGEGKGVIEWVNKDKFIFTILIGTSKRLSDLKKVYSRLM